MLSYYFWQEWNLKKILYFFKIKVIYLIYLLNKKNIIKVEDIILIIFHIYIYLLTYYLPAFTCYQEKRKKREKKNASNKR